MSDPFVLLTRAAAAVIAVVGLWPLFRGLTRLLLRNPELSWTQVEGEISESGVHEYVDRTRDFGSQTNYVARVTYAYEYRGMKFIGDRVAPLRLGFMSGSRWGPESEVRRYPRARRVTIYVNPRNPGSAVLEPGRQVFESVFLLLIGIGCFAFAVYLIRTS